MRSFFISATAILMLSSNAALKRDTFSSHRAEIIAAMVPQMEPRVWPNDKAAAVQAATCIGDVMIAAAEQLECPVHNDAIASMESCIQNSRHLRRVIFSWLPDCVYAAKHHFDIPKVAK